MTQYKRVTLRIDLDAESPFSMELRERDGVFGEETGDVKHLMSYDLDMPTCIPTDLYGNGIELTFWTREATEDEDWLAMPHLEEELESHEPPVVTAAKRHVEKVEIEALALESKIKQLEEVVRQHKLVAQNAVDAYNDLQHRCQGAATTSDLRLELKP